MKPHFVFSRPLPLSCRYFALGLLFALLTSLAAAQQDSFEKAVALYRTSKYENAKSHFETLAAQTETPALRYNLALTELALEHPAAARWQIERALLLDPLNSQYRQTQAHILKQLELPEQQFNKLASAAQTLAAPTWLWLAAISFWLLLAVCLLPKLRERRPSLGIKITRVSAALTLLIALPALWYHQQLLTSGIITLGQPVALRSAPASASPSDGVAQAGESAHIIERHHQFYKIKTASGSSGWVSTQEFQPLEIDSQSYGN